MPALVYVTASADDKIIIYEQDSESGELSATGRGGSPRPPRAHGDVDPSQRFLYVARRDVNELSTYAIDAQTGRAVASRNRAVGVRSELSRHRQNRALAAVRVLHSRALRRSSDRRRRRSASAARGVARHGRRRSLHSD